MNPEAEYPISRPMDMLASKLMAPQPGNHLVRQRLIRRLACLGDKRVVLITAGAGYGKTTLVAQALGMSEMAVVWYRLDEFDTDYTTFMTYLVQGLAARFPEMDREVADDILAASSPDRRQACLLKLAAVLEAAVDRDTAIVLDDYHLIHRTGGRGTDGLGPNVHDVLAFLMERLPRQVHLILVSRREPPIKLSTLRVRQQLLEIHEQDLAFTPLEMRALFSDIHGLDLSSAIAATVHEKTKGWAAGLILFAAAMRGNSEPENRLAKLSGGHVFSFLEENLFEIQPPEIRMFMLKTSLLDIMETRLCDRVLGINNTADRFRRMMADHLMVFSYDHEGTAFYYHHLLRDFLREKLVQTLPEEDVRKLHFDIAREMELSDNILALPHYVEAAAYDEAARLMAAREIILLIQGKIHFVRSCLERIPRDVVAKNPTFLFMEGKQYSYFGNPHKAIDCLKSACKIFRKARSGSQVAKCLVDLGAQYYYTGHIPEARGLMEQVLGEVEIDSGTFVMVNTYLIFFCAALGDIRQARDYADKALAVISQYPEFERTAATAAIRISVTAIHYFSGAYEASQALNRELVSLCLNEGLEAFLPLAYYHSSVAAYYLGTFDQGLEFARKGIRVAEKIHLRDSQKGWIHMAWAENSLGCGDPDTAMEQAEQALTIFQRPGNRWGIAYALELAARIHLVRKDDTATADALVTRALETIDGYGLDITMGLILNTRARILIRRKQYADAGDCLARNRRFIRPFAYYLFVSWILEARCRYLQGRDAWPCFQKGLAVARKMGYARFVREEAGDMLEAMAGRGGGSIFAPYLEDLAAEVSPGRNFPAVSAAAGLRIRVLGRFRVQVGDREIPDADWTSSKSRLLFQYLAVHREKGYIPRDVLLEILWPDQDASRTGKRFNVAVSRLRKILEPDLAPRSPSAYIRRKKDTYRLSLGPGGSLDFTDFHTRAAAALNHPDSLSKTAVTLGREAAAIYRRPLLEDVLYEDWCIRCREETVTLYCRLLFFLIRYHEATEDVAGAIRYAEALSAADPFNEAVYRQLMVLYAGAGQTALALKTFQTCKARMEEMDCAVSGETLALFRGLPQ